MTTPDPQYVDLLGQITAAEASGASPDAISALTEQLHTRYLALVRGGTTPHGFPYPDPTDPLAEGADAIRALAEAIDAKDTGWINLALINGWTNQSGRTVQYRRIFGIVYLRGRPLGSSSTSSTMGTLPAGFRPGQNQRWPLLMASGGTTTAVANVNTTGDVVATQGDPNLDPVSFPADA